MWTMAEPVDFSSLSPGTSIGGYELNRDLNGGQSVLATAPGNRPLVLKTLDQDCLARAGSSPKLHPNIRDRLARVRELAHGQVANLYGVERDQGLTYLVWEYVPGETLDEWARARAVSPRDLLLMAREIILAVEALHARGIVHGAIHGRNVIVDEHGKPKLTHVSPLLYSEPRHDLHSITALFNGLAESRGEEGWTLAKLAGEAMKPDGSLREVGTRASSLIDSRRDEDTEELERRQDTERRRRSRRGATAIVGVAIALALGIKWYVKEMSPKPPRPPEAPKAMLE